MRLIRGTATTIVLLLAGALGGCRLIPARIQGDGVTVQGVKDAGKPATLATSSSGESIPLPAGSKFRITRFAAQAWRPAENGAPATLAEPAKEVTEIESAGDTVWQKTEKKVSADTGTVDTSVRLHQIDVEDRRWLLWAAIGCGIAGIVMKSMLPQWPALSNGLLAGAVFAGLSWKLAAIPAWIWLAVLGIVAALIAGYKRAEWDKDKDGIPDFLEKHNKSQPPQP